MLPLMFKFLALFSRMALIPNQSTNSLQFSQADLYLYLQALQELVGLVPGNEIFTHLASVLGVRWQLG